MIPVFRCKPTIRIFCWLSVIRRVLFSLFLSVVVVIVVVVHIPLSFFFLARKGKVVFERRAVFPVCIVLFCLQLSVELLIRLSRSRVQIPAELKYYVELFHQKQLFLCQYSILRSLFLSLSLSLSLFTISLFLFSLPFSPSLSLSFLIALYSFFFSLFTLSLFLSFLSSLSFFLSLSLSLSLRISFPLTHFISVFLTINFSLFLSLSLILISISLFSI